MKYAKRIDSNQNDIVDALRQIPGVTVELDHDDILVGYKNKTHWYEIKNPSKVKKDGTFVKGALKPSQEKLMAEYTGHYMVVTCLEDILMDLGIKIEEI